MKNLFLSEMQSMDYCLRRSRQVYVFYITIFNLNLYFSADIIV